MSEIVQSAVVDVSRIPKMYEVIGRSITPLQFETRKEIMRRYEEHLEAAESNSDLYWRLWNDFPCWCLNFLTDDSGNPMFLTKWQVEFAHLFQTKKYLMSLQCRKGGKTTILAAIAAHMACGFDRKRYTVFSPSASQSFIFEKAREYIRLSPFLKNVFFDEKKGAQNTSERIKSVLGVVINNSAVSAQSLVSKRGEYGDGVLLDETQDIPRDVKETELEPIISDTYSEGGKRYVQIGTPNLKRNPNLLTEWNWYNDRANPDSPNHNPDYGVFTLNCWEAIDQGCLDRQYVLDMRDRMTPDDFAMEYLAEFPEVSTRFFTLSLLDRLRYADSFHENPRSPMYEYAMAVDWGFKHDRTQILVGEYRKEDDKMQYIYWEEIDPRDGETPYEVQARRVKRIYHHFGCRWFCPDLTSNQEWALGPLTQAEEGAPGIPITHFYHHNPSSPGFRASGHTNFSMWANHREQMYSGRIQAPTQGAKETQFFDKFVKEHHELQQRDAGHGAYKILSEPKNGFKDLAVTAGMLSLFVAEKGKRTKAFFGMGGW